MWEMDKICVELAEVFEKRLKDVLNELEIWEIAKTFEIWHRYMVLALSISETT